MPDHAKTYDLPPVMRTEDCAALHDFLGEHADVPVVLNGAAVHKFSGQAAQVICAHRGWRAGGCCDLTVAGASDGLRTALTLLGLDALSGDGT